MAHILWARKVIRFAFIFKPIAHFDVVSYADFVFASLLKFLERADRSMFEKALGYDPVLRQNYEACAQWFSIDSR